MSDKPNTPEELLSALLDEQLTGKEKERAEQLANDPQYEALWQSLMENQKILRQLPKFELPDSFADETLALAVKQSRGVSLSSTTSSLSGPHPNYASDKLSNQKPKSDDSLLTLPIAIEMRIAFGAVATLAALLLVMLVVVPQTKSKSVADNQPLVDLDDSQTGSGLAETSSGDAQNSAMMDQSESEEKTKEGSAATLAETNRVSPNNESAAPSPRNMQGAKMASAAGSKQQNATADEIWMLELKDQAGLAEFQATLQQRGIELRGNAQPALSQFGEGPYDAVFVKTSAINLNQLVKELIEKKFVASVLKIPSIPNSADFSKVEGDMALRVPELEYVSPQENTITEAEQRRQIEAINDWFDLDRSVVEEVSELKQQTFLLMLRYVRQ